MTQSGQGSVHEASRRLLRLANEGLSRVRYLELLSKELLALAGCDEIEIRLSDQEFRYRWRANADGASSIEPLAASIDLSGEADELEKRAADVLSGTATGASKEAEAAAAFWTSDARGRFGAFDSLSIHRFEVNRATRGLLMLKWREAGRLTAEAVQQFSRFADLLGIAAATRRAQARLRERVKELTCLYGIAHVAAAAGGTLEHKLQAIAELLPPAWQFPEAAAGRVLLDGRAYQTAGFAETPHVQTAAIVIAGVRRGSVQVAYTRALPEFAEGAFLPEEQSLIQSVAQEIVQIVEQSEAREERRRLAAQLQHADRLATIGQLAAGVAHELNEPLANILGYAQLLQKSELPAQAAADMQRIVEASLHAREVIRKMLLFARKSPGRRVPVRLNDVVTDGLYFVAARCGKSGIELIQNLDPRLPEITADPSGLSQVLMNLVVNAMQAMPDGGRLTVSTRAEADAVVLSVEDTGCGMTDEVKSRLFDPFFTTKDVGEGTGLGLSVVHGIVTSHGGSIQVESETGRGSRFDVRLPVIPPGDASERA